MRMNSFGATEEANAKPIALRQSGAKCGLHTSIHAPPTGNSGTKAADEHQSRIVPAAEGQVAAANQPCLALCRTHSGARLVTLTMHATPRGRQAKVALHSHAEQPAANHHRSDANQIPMTKNWARRRQSEARVLRRTSTSPPLTDTYSDASGVTQTKVPPRRRQSKACAVAIATLATPSTDEPFRGHAANEVPYPPRPGTAEGQVEAGHHCRHALCRSFPQPTSTRPTIGPSLRLRRGPCCSRTPRPNRPRRKHTGRQT